MTNNFQSVRNGVSACSRKNSINLSGLLQHNKIEVKGTVGAKGLQIVEFNEDVQEYVYGEDKIVLAQVLVNNANMYVTKALEAGKTADQMQEVVWDVDNKGWFKWNVDTNDYYKDQEGNRIQWIVLNNIGTWQ